MTNHVHLIVTPDREASLARTFGGTHAEYALALNQVANRTGHLWQNRYFSCPLDDAHLERALLYVDLNPVRAGLVASAFDWPWSSARAHSSEGLTDSVLDADWVDHAGGWDPRGLARLAFRRAEIGGRGCAAASRNAARRALGFHSIRGGTGAAGRTASQGPGAGTSEKARKLQRYPISFRRPWSPTDNRIGRK